MTDSKLIRVLKSLTEKEWKEFEKFSSSSFFNKGRNYAPLLKELKKFFPEFNSAVLTKEYIYKRLFPSLKYNESVIKVTLSGLTSLVEKFLAQTEYEKNVEDQNRFLNDSLIERKLYSLFDANYKSSLKKLNEEDLRNNSYWNYKYNFERQRYDKLMKQAKSIYTFDETLIQFDEDLKNYFLHELCRFYQPLLNQNFQFGAGEKYKLFDFLMSELEKDLESSPLTLQCYYFYFKLILTNDRKYFDKLYSCIIDIKGEFDRSELRNFYITLANYIDTMVNQDTKHVKEYFEIINVLSEKNFLLQDNGYLDPNVLKNISIMSWHDKNMASELVEKNYKKLRPEIMESTYNFCRGVIELHQKNYEPALEHFSKVDPHDAFLKINTDISRLTIYYELKYFENALSLSDSFIRFVKNHKEINMDKKKYCNEFVKHYQKLLKLNFNGYDQTENGFFKAETEAKTDLLLKKWFLKRIDELK